MGVWPAGRRHCSTYVDDGSAIGLFCFTTVVHTQLGEHLPRLGHVRGKARGVLNLPVPVAAVVPPSMLLLQLEFDDPLLLLARRGRPKR